MAADRWVTPLHSGIYPREERRRRPSLAKNCPKFGMDSVLLRPDGDPADQTNVRPGAHSFGSGDRGYSVVWWDPKALHWAKRPRSVSGKKSSWKKQTLAQSRPAGRPTKRGTTNMYPSCSGAATRVSGYLLQPSLADARAQTANADRATARLQELKRGPRVEDLEAAAARVLAARARLQVAQSNLASRRVVATRTGSVLLSRFHPGEFYNAGTGPLFVLGNVERLQVRLEVDEIDSSVPVAGAPCSIHSDDGAELTQGVVVRVAPKMGRRSLPLESPTARADIRVREVFVEVPANSNLLPSQRVWGHIFRNKAG